MHILLAALQKAQDRLWRDSGRQGEAEAVGGGGGPVLGQGLILMQLLTDLQPAACFLFLVATWLSLVLPIILMKKP